MRAGCFLTCLLSLPSLAAADASVPPANSSRTTSGWEKACASVLDEALARSSLERTSVNPGRVQAGAGGGSPIIEEAPGTPDSEGWGQIRSLVDHSPTGYERFRNQRWAAYLTWSGIHQTLRDALDQCLEMPPLPANAVPRPLDPMHIIGRYRVATSAPSRADRTPCPDGSAESPVGGFAIDRERGADRPYRFSSTIASGDLTLDWRLGSIRFERAMDDRASPLVFIERWNLRLQETGHLVGNRRVIGRRREQGDDVCMSTVNLDARAGR